MTTKTTFPTLYFLDKSEREREWKIWVVGNKVYKSYGILGMKMNTPPPRIFKGVNEGKKNATTDSQQALLQAERSWISQLDKGYYAKCKEGKRRVKEALRQKSAQGGTNAKVTTSKSSDSKTTTTVPKKSKVVVKSNHTLDLDTVANPLPMHCQTWSDKQACLKYFDFDSGVYIQPKLDGIRCVASLVGEEVLLTSRTGKQFVWLEHIRKQIKLFLGDNEDVILDGELYADFVYGTYEKVKNKYEYKEDPTKELPQEQRFDVISGACRPVRNTPHTLETQICYYVFDIIDITKTQQERFKTLNTLFKNKPKEVGQIIKVETKIIRTPEKIMTYHDTYADLGYEGVVLRSKDLVYQPNRRSLNMRKYKQFVDEEYEIVDITYDKGVSKEHFAWLVYHPGVDKNFSAKPLGTREQKLQWFKDHKKYIGKMLTVRYQPTSSDEEDHLPRFPRGIAIRDYE